MYYYFYFLCVSEIVCHIFHLDIEFKIVFLIKGLNDFATNSKISLKFFQRRDYKPTNDTISNYHYHLSLIYVSRNQITGSVF